MKILKLHEHKPLRLGHKKVNKYKITRLENEGQLNLFNKSRSEPKIFPMQEKANSFDIAYQKDEEENETAQQAYLKAIANNDRPEDAYCNLGIIEAKKGNDIKGIDYFSRALVIDPRHYEAHFNLANIYFDNENYTLAQLHYKTSLEIEPNDANIYFNLGLVQALMEEIKEAIASLKIFVSLVSEEEAQKANELINRLSNSLNF